MSTEIKEQTPLAATEAGSIVTPQERTPAQAAQESAKVSTIQQIVDLFPPEHKPTGSKLLLKLMEEARAEGAPPPRRRTDTPLSRATFKAHAQAESPAPTDTPPKVEATPVASEAPKSSAFRRTEPRSASSRAFSRSRGL